MDAPAGCCRCSKVNLHRKTVVLYVAIGSKLQGPEVIPLKTTFSTLKSTAHSVVTTPLSMNNTNTSCRSTETDYTIYCKVTLILSEALPLQISEQCNLHLPVFLVANALISGFGTLTDAIQRLAQAQRECHCHGCTYHPSVGLEDVHSTSITLAKRLCSWSNRCQRSGCAYRLDDSMY